MKVFSLIYLEMMKKLACDEGLFRVTMWVLLENDEEILDFIGLFRVTMWILLVAANKIQGKAHKIHFF